MITHGLFFDRLTVLPNLQVDPTGGYDLYWRLAGANFTPGYRVDGARKIEGGWTELTVDSDPPITDEFLLGVGTQRQNLAEPEWFRIRVFKGTELVLTSQPVDNRNRMQKREFLMYREMLRQVNLALNKVVAAVPGYLLRRKIYGPPCPNCLDEILGTPVSSECAICYGTGISGGYYDPIPMRAAWSAEGHPKKVNTTKEPSGPTQVAKDRITLFAYPEAKSEDVWVDEGTRFRYLVEKNDPLAFCGAMVEQRLTISRLPAHHPIFKYLISQSGTHPGSLASDNDVTNNT